MPRAALPLALACLLACTASVEPAGSIPTVEVETPAASRPRFEPPAKKVAPEAEAPAPEVDAPAPWSVVTVEQVGTDMPWARATHQLAEHLTLPRSAVSEPMAMGPVVVITDAGVFFAGRRVAKIAYGVILDRDTKADAHLIPALQEPLRRALEDPKATQGDGRSRGWKPVGLFADADTPFGILLDVLYTSGRAGAVSYQIAVDRPGKPLKEGSDVLQMAPPLAMNGLSEQEQALLDPKTRLIMEVSPTEVRVGRHVPLVPARSAWLERVNLEGDRKAAMKRITALARETIAGEHWFVKDLPTVHFSADPYVPLELLIAVLAAATGPDCTVEAVRDADRSRCLFSGRVVHGGSAAPPVLAGK